MTMANIRKLQFNWRLMLVQVVANALALGLTVLVLPGIRFQAERVVLALLASGFIFGLLNAFLRPILQFIMFRFLFITFGLVLVVINFFMLRMLARLTPGWFESDSILWTVRAAPAAPGRSAGGAFDGQLVQPERRAGAHPGL